MKNTNFRQGFKKPILIGIIVTVIVGVSLTLVFTLSNVKKQPIAILSESDLENYAFPGSGSKEDPYIIKNCNIEVTEVGAIGIEIRNTRSYIVIRNCEVSSAYIGIFIYSVGSGTVIIENNTVTSNSNLGGGIVVTRFSNTTIRNNLIEFFGEGIHANEASQILIENNTILNSSYQGINIRESDHCILRNNVVKYSSQHAIVLVCSSSYNLVYGNVLDGNCIEDDYEIDGERFGTISSQAYDEGIGNFWYDEELYSGNFWSDYSGMGNYTIDGSTGSEDLYPQVT